MELDWIWKAVIIIVGGTFLLRIAGRKSISQMTLAQTAIMIGIGSLLIQPVAGESIWVTLGVGGVLVLTLIVMEYLQIKVDLFENLITGKSKIVIKNGIIDEKNLRKLRMTVDQLEMNLRQKNIQRIEDVQWATLEPNGQVAVILKEDAQPVTKKDFKQLTRRLEQTIGLLEQEGGLIPNKNPLPPEQQEDIFAEIERNQHKNHPPKHLQ